MKKTKQITLILIILFSLLLPSSAYAKNDFAPFFDDQVIFGGTYTLKEGEILNGSLVIFGGVVTVEEGSFINGDVISFGGNLSISGEISGDIVAIGGILNLSETALLKGDLIAPGTVFQKEEGAIIIGQIISETGAIRINGGQITQIPTVELPELPELPEISEIPAISAIPATPFENFTRSMSNALRPITQIMWFMFRTFAVSAVAILLLLFVPAQAKRISKVIISEPLISGGLGCLTMVVIFPVMLFLGITIILSPISLILFILLCVGLFFGWIAMGQELGRRLNSTLGQEWSEAVQAGIGTFVLTFLVSSLNFIFWDIVGWGVGIVIAAIGLGAVIFTLFGTRDYPPIPASNIIEEPPTVKPVEVELVEEEKPKPKKKPKKKTSPKKK